MYKELIAGSREAQEVYWTSSTSPLQSPSGPTMDLEERLQIANHLVQLDMDVAQNQIAITLNQRRRARRRRRWGMRLWLQRWQLYAQYERLMSGPCCLQEFCESRTWSCSTGRHSTLVWGWPSPWGFWIQETATIAWCMVYGLHITPSAPLFTKCAQPSLRNISRKWLLAPPHIKNGHDSCRVQRWQFHHALGALDGKHVAIRCPQKGISLYYNYRGFHSIVLLGLVDSDYKFIWADVRSNGAESDAQIFADRRHTVMHLSP